MGPVSMPILAPAPACCSTAFAICSEAHSPRQSRRPSPSTMQSIVVFCETSRPTYLVMMISHSLCEPSRLSSDRGEGDADHPTAITRCPHMALSEGFGIFALRSLFGVKQILNIPHSTSRTCEYG